jgi:PhnB protein
MRPDNIVPEVFVHDGPAALEFYKRAFGAVELSRMMNPSGTKLLHGQLEIGGHRLVVCDEFTTEEGGTCRCPRTLGGTGVRLVLEVDNADSTVGQAVAAGATIMLPVADMFWGARYGKLMDPYGHEWGINQQIRELSEVAVNEGSRKYFDERAADA